MTRATGRRIGRGVVVTLVVAAALSACDVPVPGFTDPEPSTSTSSSTAEMPTEISSALVECDDRVKGWPDAPTDLSSWTVQGPDGYHASSEGLHFAPIEGDYVQSYFNHDVTDWPNQVGLNYFPQLARGPVTNACRQLDSEQVTARIELQASEGGATILSGPTETEVAGQPAWVVRLVYPDIDVTNDNYFVYGVDSLVHIECQWGEGYQDDVAQACAFFLDHVGLA